MVRNRRMGIDRTEFAEECVRQGALFGTNPHYKLAVAQLRSGISDDSVNGQIGPFRLTQGEWDAHRHDHEFLFEFLPDDINQWKHQCAVFALMARRAFDAFALENNRNPSARELYFQQWPNTSTAAFSP